MNNQTNTDGFWPGKLGIIAISPGAEPNLKLTLAVTSLIAGKTVERASLGAESRASGTADRTRQFTWVLWTLRQHRSRWLDAHQAEVSTLNSYSFFFRNS